MQASQVTPGNEAGFKAGSQAWLSCQKLLTTGNRGKPLCRALSLPMEDDVVPHPIIEERSNHVEKHVEDPDDSSQRVRFCPPWVVDHMDLAEPEGEPSGQEGSDASGDGWKVGRKPKLT